MNENETPLHIQQAEGLRALADFIEKHPEIETSYLDDVNVWWFDDAEKLADLARAAMRFGAKVDKRISESQYNLSITFGSLKTSALAQRGDVCERKQVGTETVTKSVPDPAKLAEVPIVEVTEEVPVYEWECKPLLASTKDGA